MEPGNDETTQPGALPAGAAAAGAGGGRASFGDMLSGAGAKARRRSLISTKLGRCVGS